jgi:hypothetical protein
MLDAAGNAVQDAQVAIGGMGERELGISSVRRWSGSAVLAYSRSGPFMERYSQKNYRNWFVLDMQWDRAQIKFPLEQRTIEIDHTSKEYEVRSGVRGGLTVWEPDDSNCTKMALALSLSDLKRQGEDVIAGFRSIRYTGLRSKNEREYLTSSERCKDRVSGNCGK